MYQRLLFTTISLAIIISSCTQDEFLDLNTTNYNPSTTNSVSIRNTPDGEYCGLTPYFCSEASSALADHPPYTLAMLDPEFTSGGEGDTGISISMEEGTIDAYHFWLSDGSLAFYISNDSNRYIIHQSQDPFAMYYSETVNDKNELTELFKLDLENVNTSEGFETALSELSGVSYEQVNGKTIYTITPNMNDNEVHGRVIGCNLVRYSAAENFIDQFTDHSGLGAVQLPQLIDDAFNSCGDGYSDPCNNCVDPRCVIDQILANDTPAIGQFQKELMAAKYLEAVLGWTAEEFNFFTAGQDNRDFMMNLYNIGSSVIACDHIETINLVFEEGNCDISDDPEVYMACIEEEIFYNHSIELGDLDRSIDLCVELECFDLMNMDLNGYYEIVLYIDQPDNDQIDSWATNPKLTVGHTFIGLKSVVNNNEISILFGFYPDHTQKVTPLFPEANGEIRNDGIDDQGNPNPREYDIAVKYVVDVSDFNGFVTSIKADHCNGLQGYNLNDSNCSDYALDFFNAWDFSKTIPDTQGNWGVGGGTNPGNLGQDIRNNYSPPGAATKIIGPATPDIPVNCIQ